MMLCFVVVFYLYRSLTGQITAIRGFKHLLSSLFASTFASRAVSSTQHRLVVDNSENLVAPVNGPVKDFLNTYKDRQKQNQKIIIMDQILNILNNNF